MALCDSGNYAALIAAKPHGVAMVMALRLLLLCYALWQSIAVIYLKQTYAVIAVGLCAVKA